MDEISRETMRLSGMLDISVRNPHTFDKFTSFEVAIQTNNPAFCSCCSRTRRRYSEFCWLKKRLKKHHPLTTPPKLPKKKTNLEKSDPQFLVQRMKELEDWLYNVVDITLYLSDTSLHLFLQTNLSCDQIDQYLACKLSESVKQMAEKECSVEVIGFSSFEASQDDQSISAPSTHSVNEPVSIQREWDPWEVEPVHIKSNSSPSRRGDSGLALSLESDIDSSCESSNASLHGSSDSSTHSFPAVTLVENDIGSQDNKKLETSPLILDQETSSASHMTSFASHMIDHSIQTSVICEGGIVYTKYVESGKTVDSETQTLGEIITPAEVSSVPQSTNQNRGVAGKDIASREEKVHQILSQLSVETGLRYSINADSNEN